MTPARDTYPDLARLAQLAQIDPHAHAGLRQAGPALAELDRLRATVSAARDDYPLLDWQGQSESPEERKLGDEIVAALAELDLLRAENTQLRAALASTRHRVDYRARYFNATGAHTAMCICGEGFTAFDRAEADRQLDAHLAAAGVSAVSQEGPPE
jgi:hypothetical protein